MTPIQLMDKLGMFELGTIAAHCVHLTDEDMDIMAAKHVRVAHNPQSNLKLASGIAPVAAMLNKGICVGLGTDGASSNNNLDMLEECRAAAMLHKATTFDPLVVPAKKAWEMATVDGAKTLASPIPDFWRQVSRQILYCGICISLTGIRVTISCPSWFMQQAAPTRHCFRSRQKGCGSRQAADL